MGAVKLFFCLFYLLHHRQHYCRVETDYRCKAKEQKKNFAVTVSQKMADRASCLLKMSTAEYQSLARKRNAVEGIPSVLRRKYHIDDMPTYGKLRSKFFVVCKVLAYNFNKVRAYLRKQRDNCTILPATE